MPSYTQLTTQIGDQWVAAIKRVGNVATKVDLPTLPVPVPKSVTKVSSKITHRVPQPHEVVAANFALAERVLVAQKDLALRLLKPSTEAPVVAVAPAAKTSAKKS